MVETAPKNNTATARPIPDDGNARPRKRQASQSMSAIEEENKQKAAGETDTGKAKLAPKEKNVPHEKLTAGGIFQYEREKRDESIEDVAGFLRIRSTYLAALEQNRFRDLPGQVYVLGYARSYAEYLGLNPEQILRQLKAEYLPYQRRPSQANSLVLMPPPSQGKKANPKMIAAGIGALIIGGIVVSSLQPTPKQAKLTPGTGLPNNDSSMLGEMAAPNPTPLPLPAPAINNSVKPPAPPTQNVKPLAPAAVPVLPPANAPTPAAPAIASNGIVMIADANSWVQVKDASGAIIYTKVMHAGENYPVPNTPGMRLTAGNLAGLHFTVNGKTLAPAGKAGTVAREIPFTPDALDKALSKFRGAGSPQ